MFALVHVAIVDLQHGVGAAVVQGIIFWVLVFMLLWAYFKVVFTDPGSVPDDYV